MVAYMARIKIQHHPLLVFSCLEGVVLQNLALLQLQSCLASKEVHCLQ